MMWKLALHSHNAKVTITELCTDGIPSDKSGTDTHPISEYALVVTTWKKHIHQSTATDNRHCVFVRHAHKIWKYLHTPVRSILEY